MNRRIAWLILMSLPSAMTLSTAHAGSFGHVTVGRRGAAGCTTNSLQHALNLAKSADWDDIIWIANDTDAGFFDGGAIEIDDQNVEIIGGFADCFGVAGPSGYKVISGAGGATESVFKIRGRSNVWLSHLEIVGGDEGRDDDGGGIDFKGEGSLTLRSLHLLHNTSGNGGGMLLRGDGDLEINVLDDVVIADNRAAKNGGGIHASGRVELFLDGSGLALHRNIAAGVLDIGGGGSDGQGGGLYVRSPARAWISARSFDGYAVFQQNGALRGGGLAAVLVDGTSADSIVRLRSHDGLQPMTFHGNQAALQGGAIYLGATDVSRGNVCADDTTFSANVAAEGAAVYVSSSGGWQGYFRMNMCQGEFARCGEGSRCSQFVGNRSRRQGLRADGAVVHSASGNSGVDLRRVRFTDNEAGSLVRTDESGSLQLQNCLMADNSLTRFAVDTSSSYVDIRHCTIVDNVLTGSHVLRIVESAGGHPARFVNSIVAEPGTPTLKHEGATAETFVRHVLSTEVATLPLHATNFVGNPGFVQQHPFDYVPGPLSDAIDRAHESADGLPLDLHGRTRPVDFDVRSGSPGERDLGCCEAQVAPRLPVLLRDGFEIYP